MLGLVVHDLLLEPRLRIRHELAGGAERFHDRGHVRGVVVLRASVDHVAPRLVGPVLPVAADRQDVALRAAAGRGALEARRHVRAAVRREDPLRTRRLRRHRRSRVLLLTSQSQATGTAAPARAVLHWSAGWDAAPSLRGRRGRILPDTAPSALQSAAAGLLDGPEGLGVRSHCFDNVGRAQGPTEADDDDGDGVGARVQARGCSRVISRNGREKPVVLLPSLPQAMGLAICH